jgi:hypothetical protein
MTEIGGFIGRTYTRATDSWTPTRIKQAAELSPPSSHLHGTHSWLVTGDMHLLWARWFAEGIVDPDRYLSDPNPFPRVYAKVRDHMLLVMPQHPTPEQEHIAQDVASLIVDDIVRRSARPSRRVWTDDDRKDLWSTGPPRCWMCGYAFMQDAADRFLGDAAAPPVPQPKWIDFMRPRGKGQHDQRVEVDHVGALGAGGDEELLRLACGWCNRHKTDRTVLYDMRGYIRWFDHPKLGRVGVPHAFWVVRALAMQRGCEHPSGCVRGVDTDELTVAPIRPDGAPNPVNLKIVCREHDPLGDDRLVPRSDYAQRLQRR